MSIIIKYPVMKLNHNGKHYFGEVKKEGAKYVPCGVGLFPINEYSFVMSEYVDDETMAGMTIIGKGNSGIVTYNDNGLFVGPKFSFNDEGDMHFELLNRQGVKEKMAITIRKDGTYYISQYDREGNFTNNVISFKKGVFCFEYRLEETKERTAVKERKAGWNFKYPFVRMFLSPYDHTKSVVPARVEEGTVYTYVGGAQTGSRLYSDEVKEEYKDNYNYVRFVNTRKDGFYDYRHPRYRERHELFTEQSRFGYAVNRYDDGFLYFGEVYDSKFGGIGCIRYPDYDYLGYVSHSSLVPDRTGMKVYKNGVIEFGSSVCFHDVKFEIHDDFMYIKSYHEGKLRGLYYKLYFDSFNMEEFSNEGNLLEKYKFPTITEEMKIDDGKPVTLRSKLTAREHLDNEMLDALRSYRYDVPKVGQIEIMEYLNSNIISVGIPDFVTGIRSDCFKNKGNIEHLYMPEKLNILKERSLFGLKGLRTLKFNENCSVEVIPTDFLDSPIIYEISIPKSVKRIAEGAFSACKSLKKAYVYSRCIIEPGALPKGCKIIYLDPVDKKELKKNKNSNAKTKIKKEVKKVEKKKTQLPKPKKTVYKPSFDLGDSLKGALKVLAYPFILLFKLFKLIFEGLGNLFGIIGRGIGSLGLSTNFFSVISIIILITTVLMNFFKINVAINEWGTDNIQVIIDLFGLYLSTLAAKLVSTSFLLNIIVAVVIVAAFLIDCVINILVVILVVVYFILFFVIGFAYALVIPVGMIALAIVGLVQDKTATNIAILVIDICLAVLFYVGFYV